MFRNLIICPTLLIITSTPLSAKCASLEALSSATACLFRPLYFTGPMTLISSSRRPPFTSFVAIYSVSLHRDVPSRATSDAAEILSVRVWRFDLYEHARVTACTFLCKFLAPFFRYLILRNQAHHMHHALVLAHELCEITLSASAI